MKNTLRLAPLSPEEVEAVEDDIGRAVQVLVTARATEFLLGLVSIPAVKAEIERQGGWGDVETYAAKLWRYELWENNPSYEHFVLLSNFKTLYDRLVSIRSALEAARDAAQVSLKDLGDRFRVNAQKKRKNVLTVVFDCPVDRRMSKHKMPKVQEGIEGSKRNSFLVC